eukprot:gene4107-4794_t
MRSTDRVVRPKSTFAGHEIFDQLIKIKYLAELVALGSTHFNAFAGLGGIEENNQKFQTRGGISADSFEHLIPPHRVVAANTLYTLSINFKGSYVAGPHIIPQPQEMTFGNVNLTIDPTKFAIETASSSPVLAIAIKRYQEILLFPFGLGTLNDAIYTLQVTVASDNEDLQLGVSENYTLSVTETSMTISADTIYGAMRALETFSQLVTYSDADNTYSINFTPVVVNDFPRFPWRGLLIDTGRHFQPASYIMHLIESLAYSKLNTLHWHVTDAPSFAAQSLTFPNMTLGSWDQTTAVYSVEDMEAIVSYGKSWGIRVVPEFDTPAHSFSWGAAFPEIITQCPQDLWDSSMIPLSPATEKSFEVIEGVYGDMTNIFFDNHFHAGGDETDLNCWNTDPTVAAWMKEQGYSTVDTESYIMGRVTDILNKLNRTKVIWNDPYTNGDTLDKDTIIEVWTSPGVLQDVVNDGFRAINSYFWYLNDMIPIPGDTYYEWQNTWIGFYQSDPLVGVTTNQHLVLGGEACIWGEQADHRSVDVRVWPRAVGIAERFWSAANVNDTQNALTRIADFSCHMSMRGVQSGPLFPNFCLGELGYYDDMDFDAPIDPLSRKQVLSILGKQ